MTNSRSEHAATVVAAAADSRPTNGAAPPAPSSALLTALTTQQFALQSAASTTVSEAVGRASIFLGVLSSSLIALGLSADRPHFLVPLLAVLTPTIFLLGLFTVVRLVDTSGENLLHLTEMARIRAYYTTLSPEASTYFPAASATSTHDALGSMGLRRSPFLSLFTLATMVVGGTAVVLLLRMALAINQGLALAGGLAFATVYLVLFLAYQSRRMSALDETKSRGSAPERSALLN